MGRTSRSEISSFPLIWERTTTPDSSSIHTVPEMARGCTNSRHWFGTETASREVGKSLAFMGLADASLLRLRETFNALRPRC